MFPRLNLLLRHKAFIIEKDKALEYPLKGETSPKKQAVFKKGCWFKCTGTFTKEIHTRSHLFTTGRLYLCFSMGHSDDTYLVDNLGEAVLCKNIGLTKFVAI